VSPPREAAGADPANSAGVAGRVIAADAAARLGWKEGRSIGFMVCLGLKMETSSLGSANASTSGKLTVRAGRMTRLVDEAHALVQRAAHPIHRAIDQREQVTAPFFDKHRVATVQVKQHAAALVDAAARAVDIGEPNLHPAYATAQARQRKARAPRDALRVFGLRLRCGPQVSRQG
jgi:hypothetical protein